MQATELACDLKFLSAMILLMWAACYGRCLAEQTGFFRNPSPALHCEGGCCEESDDGQPPQEPNPVCVICDFIKSGGAPTGGWLVLDAPVFALLPAPVMDFAALLSAPAGVDEDVPLLVDTGQPARLRMCEWMASTATPVRGPNAGA